MRTPTLALFGLVTACQLPELAPSSPDSSRDDRSSPQLGELDSDDTGDFDLDTGRIGQDDDPDADLPGDPEGRVLRGVVAGSAYSGGQVVGVSADGEVVEARIAGDGAFALSLTRGTTWTLHLRADGQPVLPFLFQRNAWSTETTTRLTLPDPAVAPPSAPPPGDEDEGDDVDLGTVTPTDSGASPESNPLEEVDADGDGVSDYEDPDDDGDGVWDELDSEEEVDTSALGLVIEKASPAHGAEGVDPDDEIIVEFSMAIDASSVSEATLELFGPDGARLPGALEVSDASLVFQPAALLQPGEAYDVVVGAGLRSSSGAELIGDQRWSFFVESELDEAPEWLAVEEIWPMDGAEIDAEATLSIEFNQPMSAATVYLGVGGLEVVGADGVAVDGELSVVDDRVYFAPFDGLVPGDGYRMVVGMQMYSETGLGLDQELEIGFSVKAPASEDDTETDPDDGTVGEDPADGEADDGTSEDPTAEFGVSSVHPSDGMEVHSGTEVKVEFTAELAASGVYQGVGGFQLVGPDGVEVEGSMEVEADQLLFFPAAPLQAGASYGVVVGMQLYSVDGASLQAPIQSGFTVAMTDDGSTADDGTAADDDADATFGVLATYPEAGGQIDAGSELMIAFTEELAASTVYQGMGGVQLIGADGVGVGVEMWVHGSEIVLMPLDGLVAGASYQLVVGMQLYSADGEHLSAPLEVGFTVAPADDSTNADGTAG